MVHYFAIHPSCSYFVSNRQNHNCIYRNNSFIHNGSYQKLMQPKRCYNAPLRRLQKIYVIGLHVPNFNRRIIFLPLWHLHLKILILNPSTLEAFPFNHCYLCVICTFLDSNISFSLPWLEQALQPNVPSKRPPVNKAWPPR